MRKVFIIAEAGVNHGGSLRIAKKLVDAASKAGADAVKFQTFQAQAFVSRLAPKAMYQKKVTKKGECQREMIKKLELDLKSHKELIKHCRTKKIMFLSSAFDLESIALLASLRQRIFKMPSGEITNLPYLRKIGSLKKKIIMSTGMSTLAEIKVALDVLIKRGTKKKDIVVLHCNTEYPTPFKDANLKAIPFIKNRLGVQVGYSDHTLGIEAAIAAIVLGATVIEKHLTLDKNMPGPDHKASLAPDEFKRMVRAIRNIEIALGHGIKKPSQSESKNMKVVRKSIVASRAIKKGDLFSEYNIAAKRLGTGISPMKWDQVIGCQAKKDFRPDELVRL